VPRQTHIPSTVVRRLPLYLRFFEELHDHGILTVSSKQLAARLGLNPAQIRKDLAHFGAFGVKGRGYSVAFLIDKLRVILQLHRDIRVALVGVGNLGQALSNYNAYIHDSMRITALFDHDPARIGNTVNRLVVQPLAQLHDTVKEQNIRIGMITVPASQAQAVADVLVQAGVEALVNFAPVILRVPVAVRVHPVDLTIELQRLAYYLNEKKPDHF
jgi:redox-sensing transcriptional repressor